MLQANPNLSWRDIKHILASTATKIDENRTTTYAGIPQYGWVSNYVGYDFHNWYGFGKINAYAAVEAAEQYTFPLGSFVTETQILQGNTSPLPDFGAVGYNQISITAPAGSSDFIEFIRVVINLDHADPRTIGLRLTSPSGTQVNIMQPYTNLGSNPGALWFGIGVNAFYGEQMTGNWILEVIDYAEDGTVGTLKGFGYVIYGH